MNQNVRLTGIHFHLFHTPKCFRAEVPNCRQGLVSFCSTQCQVITIRITIITLCWAAMDIWRREMATYRMASCQAMQKTLTPLIKITMQFTVLSWPRPQNLASWKSQNKKTRQKVHRRAGFQIFSRKNKGPTGLLTSKSNSNGNGVAVKSKILEKNGNNNHQNGVTPRSPFWV